MVEPNGSIMGSNGVPIKLVDAEARAELAKKLNTPTGLKAGMLLRVQSVGADGAIVLEGIRNLEGLACNTLSIVDANDSSGDSGAYIVPEGTAQSPRLAIYGLLGDESVALGNVAAPTHPTDATNKAWVEELMKNTGNGSGDCVKTVNGAAPDKNGNVVVSGIKTITIQEV